ncbi:MAG: OadG family protein [Acidobacteria bacterium]|nr:OadG family protein [Acidobacteriota bacterium]
MDISDALTISALGIGVVFLGLIFTSLLISSFSTIPRLLARKTEPAAEKPLVPAATAPAEIDPDILAVLTTVLEVELRLYHGHHGQRLTISGLRPSTAWTDSGRMREYPAKGGPKS